MQTKRREVFTTIRTEGALLPSDFLTRIGEGGNDIKGLKPEAYHLVPGEKINEAINRSWNRLVGVWTSFRSAMERLSPDDPATGITRERWLLHLFQELGYGRLQTSKAVDIEGKTYPISHSWERVPIHLVGCGVSLDRVTAGVAGAARSSPHSLLQEFLNRSKDHLWGFVSNGLRLRILRDNISLTRLAFAEFDLESMMNGEVYADFTLLWLLCHQSRVEAERPELCRLEEWSKAARDQGTRSLDQLRNGVEEAITALGTGFLAHPSNSGLKEKLRSGALSGQDFYRQLLRTVYRLLFLFVAEDRDLLLDPACSGEAGERYLKYYSTARLRKLAERRKGTKHHDIWKGVALIFRLLGDEKGCPELGLPALGSFLWSERATPDLEGCEISNSYLLDAIRALAFTIDKNVRRAVDYKNLGSEELGSIYESLLELHPVLNGDAATFGLETAGGHERKTTGSYYTPSSLINCLLDSALDPVLEEAANKPNPEQAILNLKVCDPACGSGHFLIAAAHRIAKRLAADRTGDEEPSPDATRAALRDVIGRCIYGVDINPMAVELCKVSLWIEALEPGKPLSFLEHRILCGNSLLGATPALLKDGIPDDAFKPIEGDDKKLCTQYKKRNRSERTGQQDLFTLAGEPWERLGDLATSIAHLGEIDDSTIDGLKRKQDRYEEIVRSSGYLYGRLWADSWCAAFVWRKTDDPNLPYAITEEIFRKIEKSPHSIPPWMRDEIRRLANQYQFFHWHLAFPDVFRVPADQVGPENNQTGWSGGFDVVLGNPPWEKLKLHEKEWFAEYSLEIANAPNKAIRRRMIAELEQQDPQVYEIFIQAKRESEGTSVLIRNTGRYPLCGHGDLNTYAVFAEANRSILGSTGRVGCIVPLGIATDDTAKLFFQDLMATRTLVSLYGFENEEHIFPAIDHRNKFCLLTLCGPNRPHEIADMLFFARQTSYLSESDRHFSICADDFAVLNPNTRTCPIFRYSRDAELTKKIFHNIPILVRETTPQSNPWGIKFRQGLFHLTNDIANGLVVDSYEKGLCNEEMLVGLYEAKLMSQFDHRFASYENGPGLQEKADGPSEVLEILKEDPYFAIKGRYFTRGGLLADRIPTSYCFDWFVVYRDVTNATNERTVVATIIPRIGVAYTLRVATDTSVAARTLCCLLATLNAFVLDFAARQIMAGTHLSDYIIKQLPVLPPDIYEQKYPLVDSALLEDWICQRVLELTYTAWDLHSLARDCGYHGPPFRWSQDRRFLNRCELDAAYFHLYGIERGDVDYIMDTFPVVRQRDEKEHGEYRTKRVILEVYDAMADAMRTGRPYETILSPPPADPSVAHEALDIPAGVAVAGSVPMIDPTFPSTEREELLCAMVLELVHAAPGRPSLVFLDLLLLATRPDTCEKLLPETDRQGFAQEVKQLPKTLRASTDQHLGWRQIRQYLETAEAIEVRDRRGEQRLSPGRRYTDVRQNLPTTSTSIVPYLLRAVERMEASQGEEVKEIREWKKQELAMTA